VLLILLVFGIRYLKSRENMALIERGLIPPGAGFPFNRLVVNACLCFGISFGLLIGHFAAKTFLSDNPALSYVIFLFLFLGLGLTVAYQITNQSDKPES
jgi:hypothetical protein